jgi:hypothetical protein
MPVDAMAAGVLALPFGLLLEEAEGVGLEQDHHRVAEVFARAASAA